MSFFNVDFVLSVSVPHLSFFWYIGSDVKARTNVRKALRLALSSPSEIVAMLKGLKNTRTKQYKVRHKTNYLVEKKKKKKTTKSKTNTGSPP